MVCREQGLQVSTVFMRPQCPRRCTSEWASGQVKLSLDLPALWQKAAGKRMMAQRNGCTPERPDKHGWYGTVDLRKEKEDGRGRRGEIGVCAGRNEVLERIYLR